MKRCLIVFIFTCVFFCFYIHSFAENSVYSGLEANLQDLYADMPEELNEIMEKNKLLAVDEILSFDNIVALVADSFVKAFSANRYSVFLGLAFLVFIGEVLNKSLNSSMARITDIAVILVGGLSVFELLNGLCVNFIDKFTRLSAFASSVATVAVTAIASSAAGSSAAVLGVICSVLFSFFNYVCSCVVLPFVNIYLCVNLSGTVTGDFNLQRMSSFLRNTSIGIISFVLFLFSCIMSVQSSVAMAQDTFLKKTLKQLLSSGLPVLGGYVSDGMDAFFTSVLGLKNTVGVLGISSTVVMAVYPVADLFVCFLVLSFVCFLLSFFEGVSLYGFMLSARDVISVLLCITLSLSVMVVLMFYFIVKVV